MRISKHKFAIGGGDLLFNGLELSSNFFYVRGNGSYTANGRVTFAGSITFDTGFSDLMFSKIKELIVFRTVSSNLSLPFRVEGADNTYSVQPDFFAAYSI